MWPGRERSPAAGRPRRARGWHPEPGARRVGPDQQTIVELAVFATTRRHPLERVPCGPLAQDGQSPAATAMTPSWVRGDTAIAHWRGLRGDIQAGRSLKGVASRRVPRTPSACLRLQAHGQHDRPAHSNHYAKRQSMAFGPVDVMIISFPGNKFTGRIAPALMELVDSGTIRSPRSAVRQQGRRAATGHHDRSLRTSTPTRGRATWRSTSSRAGRARPRGRRGGRATTWRRTARHC